MYKGNFTLIENGTYRWYNGTTGKYQYNPATGTITWLSGYFANDPPKKNVFKPGKVAGIEFQLKDSYTWTCGCNQ